MSSVYLSQTPASPFPFVERKEDHPQQEAESSLLCPIFFNIAQDQRGTHLREVHQNQQKFADDDGINGHKILVWKREEGDESKSDGSMKWMQKMMNSNYSSSGTDDRAAKVVEIKVYDEQEDKSSEVNSGYHRNDSVRACADCYTTKTPLWRSGPRGPKSLCNACGIRQRKAKRAMAAAAGISADAFVSPKAKKSCGGYVTQHKKIKPRNIRKKKKASNFEDFALSLNKNSDFQQVFPQDEEEAAILLMALSCGLA